MSAAETASPPGSPPAARDAPDPASAGEPPRLLGVTALYLSAFLIATCGLIYELVSGAAASYLLGDSVTQFSLVIGVYLSAMGLGSYLSKYVQADLLVTFLRVELAVGVVGGFSALALFASYAYLGSVRPLLFTQVGIVGALVGLEIPVLMRVLKDDVAFSELVARVLAFDYLGALAASLLFPLVLVPLLGLHRTALLFGLLNVVVALALSVVFRERLAAQLVPLRLASGLAGVALLLAFWGAGRLSTLMEQQIYDAPVLFKRVTPYQSITVTRWREDVRLLLDGHLQFSSVDEHRYHEALVHPAAASLRGPLRTALVLGGGDGMALRELLRYPSLERATLVDLDPAITDLFAQEPMLRALNGNAYADPRVEVVNADGLKWLEGHSRSFDLVVVDLPDPRNYALAKLYTRGFYRLVRRHLARGGALAVQATTPYGPPADPPQGARAFWCIARTIEDAGFTVHPYHAYVPSFGDWGFVLGLPREGELKRGPPRRLVPDAQGLRFLNEATLNALFAFPEDLRAPPVEINRLNEQVLVGYYADDWGGRDGS